MGIFLEKPGGEKSKGEEGRFGFVKHFLNETIWKMTWSDLNLPK